MAVDCDYCKCSKQKYCLWASSRATHIEVRCECCEYIIDKEYIYAEDLEGILDFLRSTKHKKAKKLKKRGD